MIETTDYQVWTRNLPLGEKLEALRCFASERHRSLQLGNDVPFCTTTKHQRIQCWTIEEAAKFLARNPFHAQWRMTVGMPVIRGKGAELSVSIAYGPNRVSVSIDTPDLDLLYSTSRHVASLFGFAQLPDVDGSGAHADPPHARAFIGCHFDEEGLKLGRRLELFLRLLRFHTIQIATPYAGKDIPDKVREGIASNDLYIGVVSGKRDHQWIDGEASFALGQGKKVILIVQEGADYSPSISGRDREHIPFRYCIDEAFIGLLEGFRDMRVVGIH